MEVKSFFMGSSMKETGGRTLLLAVAGYLCCLAGFEVSRIWDFFRVDFRPLTTLALCSAFLASLGAAEMSREERHAASILLAAWCSVTCFPLVVPSLATCLGVLLLGVALSFVSLKGRAAEAGLVGTFLLAGLSLVVPDWVGASVLSGILVVEVRRRQACIPDWQPGPVPVGQATRAEIYWKGFAGLYRSAAPGEGPKFKQGIVRDTLQMLQDCGANLESGTEDRGLYRFPDPQSLEACRQTMEQYGEQVDGVLRSVKAPPLELVFERKWG